MLAKVLFFLQFVDVTPYWKSPEKKCGRPLYATLKRKLKYEVEIFIYAYKTWEIMVLLC